MHPLLKIQRTSTKNKLNPGLVASYDLQPGNGAGPIFWKVREEEIEEKVRRIKKVEGKIQIGKVSKNKNTNEPHSHNAEINK